MEFIGPRRSRILPDCSGRSSRGAPAEANPWQHSIRDHPSRPAEPRCRLHAGGHYLARRPPDFAGCRAAAHGDSAARPGADVAPTRHYHFVLGNGHRGELVRRVELFEQWARTRTGVLTAAGVVIAAVTLAVTVAVAQPDGTEGKAAPTQADRIAAAAVAPDDTEGERRWLIESSIGIANVTKGDTRYESIVENVDPGDRIEVQVFVRNREVEHDVEGVRLRIEAQSDPGPSLQISSHVRCTGCYSISGSVTAAVGVPARLQLVPDSVNWRSTSRRGAIDRPDGDAVVTSPSGALWGQLAADPDADSLTVTALFDIVAE